MRHEDGLASQATDKQRHGIGQSAEVGIAPSTAVPPTVLVTELDNGALLLQGRPDGPRTYLSPADDALALRRELAAAFRRSELSVRGGQDEVL
ncbi:MAG: hypothetical protein M3Y48_21795 [Actinomycetota bacterium]|nr:hypothetical protein [Actinomycetota bacterium]